MHFEWKQGYSVGHEILDSQHKRIFEIINQIEDVQLYEKELIVEDILKALVCYIDEHFKTEETFMAKWNLPKDYINRHIMEHMQERKRILDLVERYYMKKEAFISMEIINELKNWIIVHVLGTDKEYTPYVKE